MPNLKANEIGAWKGATWIHLVGGIAFLVVPVILAPQPPDVSRFQLDPPTIRDFFSNLLILCFFYLNFFVLIPRFFLRKNYFIYATWDLIALALVILIPKLGISISPRPEMGPGPRPFGPNGASPRPFVNHDSWWNYLADNYYQILLFLVMVMFSIALKFREILFQTRQQNVVAEIKNL